jgi:hypothetical protein
MRDAKLAAVLLLALTGGASAVLNATECGLISDVLFIDNCSASAAVAETCNSYGTMVATSDNYAAVTTALTSACAASSTCNIQTSTTFALDTNNDGTITLMTHNTCNPAPTGSGCYKDSTTPVSADCTCHPSCYNCGYYDMPTAENDCITCADSNVQVNVVFSDGTGYCSTTSTTSSATTTAACPPNSFWVYLDDCVQSGYLNNDGTKSAAAATVSASALAFAFVSAAVAAFA